MDVAVSILPQKYFVQKIAGDLLNTTVMVPPGANPATYEPTPQQMVRLTKSKLYFAVGVPFETVWLPRFKRLNSKMAIIHTQAGIHKIPMKAHLHEPGQTHGSRVHGGIKDPHIWLSPPLVMLQARNILEGVLKIDPKNRETYETNYKNFIQELVALDLGLMNRFRKNTLNRRFMVYHPAWGYFARAYGLRQIPIEMEGKNPTPKELQALIDMARKLDIRVIFVQTQFPTKSADAIARAIGGRVMTANPLAENWAENLKQMAASFSAALK